MFTNADNRSRCLRELFEKASQIPAEDLEFPPNDPEWSKLSESLYFQSLLGKGAIGFALNPQQALYHLVCAAIGYGMDMERLRNEGVGRDVEELRRLFERES